MIAEDGSPSPAIAPARSSDADPSPETTPGTALGTILGTAPETIPGTAPGTIVDAGSDTSPDTGPDTGPEPTPGSGATGGAGGAGQSYASLFEKHRRGREARRLHAAAIADICLEYRHPASAVDVGCGLGFFLAALSERGVPDLQGIDGDWVSGEQTEIPRDVYLLHDLETPLSLPRRYDIAACLEVGEHLSPARSAGLVADLAALSDWVLFSAAVPGQGGSGHVACRWQSDWAQMFAAEGYLCHDPFRRRLAGIEGMAPWFAQNLLLFVRDGAEMAPDIATRLAEHRIAPRAADMILPHYHERLVAAKDRRFRGALKQLRDAGLRFQRVPRR